MNVPAKTYETEIVGVVKDFKFNDPRQNYWPVTFLPLAQSTGPESYAAFLEVRATGNPTSVAGAVRQAIQEVDKNLPITGIRTLREQVNEALNKELLIARLSSFFGVLALLLACIGLYGILSFAVARRTNEIGIRMALGARQGDILGMVLREALLLAAMGIGIGLAAAFGVSRYVSSQLYGLAPSDPLTLAAATVILTAVAIFAALVPARRAARVDPMVALRYE